MKELAILLLLLFLAACAAPEIHTVDQALEEIMQLDMKYGTDFEIERVNKMILNTTEIDNYLADLQKLEKRARGETERQQRHISWLISAREQMLLSQSNFQKGWLGVGEEGRVTDGFSCSEISWIREETALLEEAWRLGVNATRVLDSLLTENTELQQEIGIGSEKPEFYDSSFDQLWFVIKSNVDAMKIYCDTTIETKYLNFTQVIKNGTETA